MEDANPNANNRAIVEVSDENTSPPPNNLVLDHAPMVYDDDREYSCRYCDKKFSNMQALGGHQNAHKIERAFEQNKFVQENHAGPFGGYPSAYPAIGPSNSFGSFDVAVPYPSPSPYNSLSDPLRMYMAGEPYGLHPLDNYAGWTIPVPGFPPASPSSMQGDAHNPIEMGDSGAAPASEGPPVSAFIDMIGRGENNNQQIRAPEDDQSEDPNGLDLTLKLGYD